MDINDLNKSQLLLLAILLSFITSIATGITTVTLMEQAPVSVTAPINRVIQQTVEKIQQVEGKTTVQTVVVKEEDLVVDALAKNQSASFGISRELGNDDNGKYEDPAGRGFAVSNKNIIVADSSLVQGNETYLVQNSSGKFRAEFVGRDSRGLSFLKVGEPLDGTSKLTYTVPEFADMSKMKIGQKVLILASSISTFIFQGERDIKTNITSSHAGGMVMNLEGEVLGIALMNPDNAFVPATAITEALTAQNLD